MEKNVIDFIVNWLKEKSVKSNQKGFVVGVSGGVDSATVSTLCAETGFPVICLSMPIGSEPENSRIQLNWLKEKYSNVSVFTVNLTDTFDKLKYCLPEEGSEELALVNTRSRLRMAVLYAFSGSNQYLVAGTGNKVEDYGIGFFTKYGDGGVDISPIGDLKKTEVYKIASYLNVPQTILDTKPTDGLWEDGRTDEDQIGTTYENLEWAMNFCDALHINNWEEFTQKERYVVNLSDSKKKILHIYLCRHELNKHKMEIPPVCLIEKQKKNL